MTGHKPKDLIPARLSHFRAQPINIERFVGQKGIEVNVPNQGLGAHRSPYRCLRFAASTLLRFRSVRRLRPGHHCASVFGTSNSV